MKILWNNRYPLSETGGMGWDPDDEDGDDAYTRSNEDDDEDLIPVVGDDDDDARDEDDEFNDEFDLPDKPTSFEAPGDFTPSHGRTTGSMLDHEPGLNGPVGGRQ